MHEDDQTFGPSPLEGRLNQVKAIEQMYQAAIDQNSYEWKTVGIGEFYEAIQKAHERDRLFRFQAQGFTLREEVTPVQVMPMGPPGWQGGGAFTGNGKGFDLQAVIEEAVNKAVDGRMMGIAADLRVLARRYGGNLETAIDHIAAVVAGSITCEEFTAAAVGQIGDLFQPMAPSPAPLSSCCGAPMFPLGDRLCCERCRLTKPR